MAKYYDVKLTITNTETDIPISYESTNVEKSETQKLIDAYAEITHSFLFLKLEDTE